MQWHHRTAFKLEGPPKPFWVPFDWWSDVYDRDEFAWGDSALRGRESAIFGGMTVSVGSVGGPLAGKMPNRRRSPGAGREGHAEASPR